MRMHTMYASFEKEMSFGRGWEGGGQEGQLSPQGMGYLIIHQSSWVRLK